MPMPGLIKNFSAEATINPYRIVKYGTADGGALQGAASTDFLMGITDRLGADASGDRVDVIKSGIAEVEYGGAVTRGDPVTSDSDGKAVQAAPSAGVNARIVGFAEVSAVSGDIGDCHIAPGQIQGA